MVEITGVGPIPNGPTAGDYVPVIRVSQGTARPYQLSIGQLLAMVAPPAAVGPSGVVTFNGRRGAVGLLTTDVTAALGTGAAAAQALTLGTLATLNSVPLASIAQSGATLGQLLAWSGSSWAPATITAGTTYTGVAPISVAGSMISLAQAGAATGQVLAWSGSAWAPTSLTGSYTLPAASTTQLGGVKSDGSTVNVANDGTLSVVSVSVTSLTDVSSGSLGGPALSDLDTLSRGGVDYRTTLGARGLLFRRTPAPSRTVTLSSGSTTATLTAADNDRTVVVTGVAGTLTVDGTITDGFRAHVINHTGSALALSGITGLSASTIPNAAASTISLANSAAEATTPSTGGGGSYTLPPATTSVLGGIKPDGSSLAVTSDGTLSVVTTPVSALTAATQAAGSDLFVGYSTAASADQKYTLTQISSFGQSNIQSWTTAGRPTIAANAYAEGFNITLGRFEYWNGGAWVQHVRLGDLSASAGQLFGGTGAAGSAVAVTVGTGLTLSGGTLSASSGSSGIVPAASSNSGANPALAFPASGSSAFDITLTANATFTLSGGATGQLQTITLVIRGGAGGFTATLPSNIKWPGGSIPAVDTSSGSYNEFYLRTIDGGTTYSGNY